VMTGIRRRASRRWNARNAPEHCLLLDPFVRGIYIHAHAQNTHDDDDDDDGGQGAVWIIG